MSRLHRDIAALADGSYEVPGLRERIAASPELAALLDEQQRAVAVTRAARPAAPAALRDALAGAGAVGAGAGDVGARTGDVGAGAGDVGARAGAARPVARPRGPMLGFAVATAGVIALAVIAILPSRAAPSVTSVATLAARGPIAPPPLVDPGRLDTLRSQVDGVRYPDWEEAFGFRSSGARTDRVDGRTTMTVYYAKAAQATVGYTIVSGRALPEPAGSVTQVSFGTRFVGLTRGGRSIVTWRRAGHTCVISASGAPLPTLLRLAEWRYAATPA
jgi:hypothetical protein